VLGKQVSGVREERKAEGGVRCRGSGKQVSGVRKPVPVVKCRVSGKNRRRKEEDS